jgi:hypothetical protein
MRFSSFIDKKNREARRELGIIRDILSEAKLKVDDFLKDEVPYLFLKNTDKDLDFDGVRIYKIGSSMAYRVQKESKTEPYGEAYLLDVEDIFGDLITDMSEEKAANKVKEAVVEEFKSFFRKSVEAQDEIAGEGGDPQSKIIVNGSAGDLSNAM